MKYNVSDLANSSNYSVPGGETLSGAQIAGGPDPNISYAVNKLSGYNEGFQKALSTYHDIVLVIFLTQLIQIVTHRFLYKDYPLSITISDPFGDEVYKRIGSDYQPGPRAKNIISTLDGALFATGLTLAAYLVLQVFGVPAYSWEVTYR